ncbi:unnamed protein product [Microthlaspi erraticum]|uniref:F-box domain-containing protein n=1 Tax=Microthlaspi erraticum TaxID=1685480 RepID=A0A6D2JH51_9BRAS|nr:unnamed protein product [Microthlaspi erraticum]
MTPIDIPLDLQSETLLRLPVKSLLRFRCVSKLWSSIITSRDFRNRHMNIATSSAPTHLLIAFKNANGEEHQLVSSPNPKQSSSFPSSCCVPYRDLSLLKLHGDKVSNVGRGLICVADYAYVAICNPSTRQLHTFPQLKLKDDRPKVYPGHKYFFGYDPVEDQYKVLAVDGYYNKSEHKVVAVGREEAWREAPCVACRHVARTSGMFMNGTIYYRASALRNGISISIIVAFDVRFETYNIINVPSQFRRYYSNRDKTLINYGGKVGVVENPRGGKFRLWVVEDAEKEEWSLNTFHLPESAAGLDLKVLDAFNNGEICLVQKELSDPFCLYYYNLEKKSMRSVIIEGLPISELNQAGHRSVTVSDHYENFTTF